MKFTRELPTAIMIRKVAEGEIHIGNSAYSSTIALTNDEVMESWTTKSVGELTPGDLEQLLNEGAEVVVLGTGVRHEFAPKEIMFALARKGVGFEVMDTAAAARTYNVLAGEGRRVAAVLYI